MGNFDTWKVLMLEKYFKLKIGDVYKMSFLEKFWYFSCNNTFQASTLFKYQSSLIIKSNNQYFSGIKNTIIFQVSLHVKYQKYLDFSSSNTFYVFKLSKLEIYYSMKSIEA